MRRIPLAIGLMAIILIFISVSQFFIYDTFNRLSQDINSIEAEQGDIQELAQNIKTTFAQRQGWLLTIADNNQILQLGMVIDTLDPQAEPEEIVAHTKHIKAELTRIRRLLLPLL